MDLKESKLSLGILQSNRQILNPIEFSMPLSLPSFMHKAACRFVCRPLKSNKTPRLTTEIRTLDTVKLPIYLLRSPLIRWLRNSHPHKRLEFKLRNSNQVTLISGRFAPYWPGVRRFRLLTVCVT